MARYSPTPAPRAVNTGLRLGFMLALVLLALGAPITWRLYLFGRLAAAGIASHDPAGQEPPSQGWGGHKLLERYELQSRAARQLHRYRGPIVDREGRLMASTVPATVLYVHPDRIPERCYEGGELGSTARLAPRLAALVGRANDEGFVARLGVALAKRAKYVRLGQTTDPEVVERFTRLRAAHRGCLKEAMGSSHGWGRVNPFGDLASGVLGFTNRTGGAEGLEKWMDLNVATLVGGEGVAGTSRVWLGGLRNNRGNVMIPLGDLPSLGWPETPGIVLGMDSTIQALVERELCAAVRSSRAKDGGWALVMDVRTGDLLAMAELGRGCRRARRKPSRFTVETFEPGSVMKTFVVSAALDEGIVGLDTKVDCEGGRFRIGRKTIRDHHGYDELSVEEVLEVSSNIGAAKLAFMLGQDRLVTYLRRFGFLHKTGCIGCIAEPRGYTSSPLDRTWPQLTLANVGFGQGIGVSAIQLVSAMAAVARGGSWIQPRLVKGVLDTKTWEIRELRPEVTRVIRESTAAAVTAALLKVVEGKHGTARRAKVPGIRVAGKTGTAEQFDPRLKRYEDVVASFLGFAPADDPEIVVLVSISHPALDEDERYGGLLAAPVFSKIVARVVPMLRAEPRGGAR